MATDLQFHNELIAEDVNQDFDVSPIDALLVINTLNRNITAPSGEGEGGSKGRLLADVSGDGVISPLDALMVINRLNAEGEGEILKYEVRITDTSGNQITQTSVGQTFRINVYVQDLLNTRPRQVGVYSAAVDLDLRVSGGAIPVEDLVQYPANTSNSFRENLITGPTFIFPTIPDPVDPINNPELSRASGSKGAAGSNEEFNEIAAFGGVGASANFGLQLFFSTDVLAKTAGTLIVDPNIAEEGVNDTLLFEEARVVLPTEIAFIPDSILIIADPTSPVAVNDTVTTPEDTAIILAGAGSTLSPALTANDTFTAGRTISVTSLGAIAGVTQGTVSGLTYTPKPNFSGQDVITYTITDSPNGLTSTATVTINVTEVNDPPVATADAFTIPGDSTANPLNVLANDNVGGGENQTLTITGFTTPSNGGTVTIVGGTSISYTPAVGFEGTETFNYTVSDGQASATATVTITVEPATTPFARRDTATIAEVSAGGSGSVTINVLANDKVNTGTNVKATLISFTQPANGTVTLNDGGTAADTTDDQLVYVPNFEFNGTDTFTYVMNDTVGTGANSTGTVVVTVTDVNDAPIAGNDDLTAVAATEDVPVTIAISTLLANDSPGLGETTTQTLTVSPGTSSTGTVAVSGNNVVFSPNTAVNGQRTFTYIITDTGTPALTATGTVTVNLAAVNDAPIAGADTRSTDEDTPLVITAASLLANDAPGRPQATDESTQTLSITGVNKPTTTTGTVSLANGNITYSPAPHFNGTETFTYTVLDSAGASSTGTVTVTVNPINDAPEAGIDSVVAFKGVALQIPVADLLANDAAGPVNSNEGGQTPLTITGVSGAVNGTVSLNTTTGIITFTPAPNYSGPASFQYTVADSGPTGGTNVNTGTGTVNVTVRDFVPTTISGTVWVDDTHDGIIDAAERKLGGVEVILTGNAVGIPITPRTYITLADGSYHFDNLAPGEYVVRFATPAYFSSAYGPSAPGGNDVAGGLGDADSVDNQFTINVAQPGGGDGSGYNFAIAGLETRYLGLFSSLLASNFMGNPANIRRGLEATLSDDNSSIWMTKLEGFDNMVAGEVVLNSAGNRLQLTMVDANEAVYTATLMPSQFRVVTDNATGNRLVRVFGDASSINFQQISLAAPPVVSFNRYLEAIDEIFAQEGWDGVP
ncbi:MAG: Ig-like domain-containing protein [Pirellulaceae bacterium]|nr:Ig-like domain-containing protein [Pirellulaceae bacterium]